MTRPYSTPLWEKKFREFKTLGHGKIRGSGRLVAVFKKSTKTATFSAFARSWVWVLPPQSPAGLRERRKFVMYSRFFAAQQHWPKKPVHGATAKNGRLR